jgi:hypothetical protein
VPEKIRKLRLRSLKSFRYCLKFTEKSLFIKRLKSTPLNDNLFKNHCSNYEFLIFIFELIPNDLIFNFIGG